MNANRIAKESQVKEIIEKINASESLVVAEYAGLTVAQTQELRKQLKANGVELKVYKNRLVKLAMEETGFGDINSKLTGQNAFAFGMEDGISPAKIITEFSKENDVLKLKAGTYEGKVIDLDELKVIASLPNMEEALTMLAMSMLAPIRYVGTGLHMLTTEGHLETDATEEVVSAKETPATETAPAVEEAKTEETAPAVETETTQKEEAPATEIVEEAKGE